MARGGRRRDPAALRLHPAVARLVASGAIAWFTPVSETGPVGVTAGGVAVTGIGCLLAARTRAQKTVPEVVLPVPEGEDPAVIAGTALKDLLNGSRDPFALGAAWEAFNWYCTTAKRPRKGYAKTKYMRTFGVEPVERLRAVTRDTFGFSDDQLRRFSALLRLPPELQTAFRAGSVTLRALVALADQPRSVVAAVVADVKAGVAPAVAVARHLPERGKRPDPQTALRRLCRAGKQARADLADRAAGVGYLRDADRSDLGRTRELIDALLALATEGEVIAHVTRALGGDARKRPGPKSGSKAATHHGHGG